MKTEVTITPEMRINEVVTVHPETVRVFHRLGLDTCCGGAKTVAEAAAAHQLDVEQVLRELNGAQPA